MSILSKIFGGSGNKSPMNAANQYLNQIPGLAHQGYDPYVSAGMNAGTQTQGQYEKLINDPADFINQLMKQYQTSEGYNFEKDLLTKEMGNTAAMGGIAGTPLDQMNQAQGVQGLLSKDMQQFLTNVLGQYDKGLAGEEGIANRGFEANKNLTDFLGNNLTQQGSLAFNDAQQKNKNKGDLWSMFGKALGGGAGFALGGLPGAAVGAGIFGGK